MTVKCNIRTNAFGFFKKRKQAALDGNCVSVAGNYCVALNVFIGKIIEIAGKIVIPANGNKVSFGKALFDLFKIARSVTEEENKVAVFFRFNRAKKVFCISVAVGQNKSFQS